MIHSKGLFVFLKVEVDMRWRVWGLVGVLMLSCAGTASAEGINYHALKREGFREVADLLRSMTPEQREEILRQARQVGKDLEKMSPKEREALIKSLRGVQKDVDIENIDPEKLDPALSKDLHGIRKDIGKYEEKRKAEAKAPPAGHRQSSPAPQPRKPAPR